jgi:hypothetical protein
MQRGKELSEYQILGNLLMLVRIASRAWFMFTYKFVISSLVARRRMVGRVFVDANVMGAGLSPRPLKQDDLSHPGIRGLTQKVGSQVFCFSGAVPTIISSSFRRGVVVVLLTLLDHNAELLP